MNTKSVQQSLWPVQLCLASYAHLHWLCRIQPSTCTSQQPPPHPEQTPFFSSSFKVIFVCAKDVKGPQKIGWVHSSSTFWPRHSPFWASSIQGQKWRTPTHEQASHYLLQPSCIQSVSPQLVLCVPSDVQPRLTSVHKEYLRLMFKVQL